MFLWSRISVISAGVALSSFQPNVSISSGHITLDAVLGRVVWMFIVRTILTGTIILQDLVFDAIISNTLSIVTIRVSEHVAVKAVT